MPRYFFHTEDEELVLDEDGCELEDVAAARLQAASLVGRLLLDEPERLARADLSRVICIDEAGAPAFVLQVSLAAEPPPRPAELKPTETFDA